jgi:hypothetical protein
MNIDIEQIKSTKDSLYKQAIDIYIDSFPSSERQSLATIAYRINCSKCKMIALVENNFVLGMAIIWKFSNDRIGLIDYIAIEKNNRNRGLGGLLLTSILNEEVKIDYWAIEIEHPNYGTNIMERKQRLRFYLTNGARIASNIKYFMPAQDNSNDIEMLILFMSKTNDFMDIKKEDIIFLLEKIYFEVYSLDPKNALAQSILSEIPQKIKIKNSI